MSEDKTKILITAGAALCAAILAVGYVAYVRNQYRPWFRSKETIQKEESSEEIETQEVSAINFEWRATTYYDDRGTGIDHVQWTDDEDPEYIRIVCFTHGNRFRITTYINDVTVTIGAVTKDDLAMLMQAASEQTIIHLSEITTLEPEDIEAIREHFPVLLQ